jgi:hypothetical protein
MKATIHQLQAERDALLRAWKARPADDPAAATGRRNLVRTLRYWLSRVLRK